jgi:hypothetical protein
MRKKAAQSTRKLVLQLILHRLTLTLTKIHVLKLTLFIDNISEEENKQKVFLIDRDKHFIFAPFDELFLV